MIKMNWKSFFIGIYANLL